VTHDRRLTPFNGRVAHISLRGQVDAAMFVEPQARAVAAPLADLCATPAGARDRQLLRGARFDVLEQRDAWAFGIAVDGYCGWLATGALGPWQDPTHRVLAPATHLYPLPDVKTPAIDTLSLGSAVRIIAEQGPWLQEAGGAWLPSAHLREVGDRPEDPVSVAESLLGTPYLWGGNSRAGLDCSGLVQIACFACGIECPADSDMQAAALGYPLADDAALARADLVFWKGHVGWMADEVTLLHANAHHMAVVHEPLDRARARIEGAGGGGIVIRRRLGAPTARA